MRASQWASVALAVATLVSPNRRAWFAWCDVVAERWRVRLGVLALGLATTFFLVSKLAQQAAFQTGAFDLTMIHSAVHNTLHGRFLFAFGLERNFLAEHASFILLSWVPLYALLPHVETLLVLQVLATALSGWPLFALARRSGLPRVEAGLIVAAWWVNPILWRSFVFDIHMELWVPLFIFTTAACAAARRWWWFWCFAILSLCVKEDVTLSLSALALLLLAYDRAHWRQACALLIVSVVWLWVATKVVIPLAAGDGSHQSHFLGDRYAHLGPTAGQIIWRLLSDPPLLFELFTGRSVRSLLGSVGPVAVLDPIALLATMPQIAIHRASNYPAQRDFSVYYGLFVVTTLFIAAPGLISRVGKRFGRTGALVIACLTNLPSGSDVSPPAIAWPTRADFAANERLAVMPDSATVDAQSCLLPHLPVGAKLSLFPDHHDASWLALSLRCSSWPMTPRQVADAIRQAIEQHGYHVEFINSSLILMHQGPGEGLLDAAALHAANQVLESSSQ